MTNGIEFSPTLAQDIVLKQKQMGLEAGWFGHVFGTGKNAPVSIAGFIVVVLTLSGVLSLFVRTAIPASEYWSSIVPIITLVMGFIFGKGSRES